MSKKDWATVTLDGVTLDVDFTYYPPSRGARDKWGCPLEPDEPGELDITTVKTDSGDDITPILTEEQFERIGQLILMQDNG